MKPKEAENVLKQVQNMEREEKEIKPLIVESRHPLIEDHLRILKKFRNLIEDELDTGSPLDDKMKALKMGVEATYKLIQLERLSHNMPLNILHSDNKSASIDVRYEHVLEALRVEEEKKLKQIN